MDQVEPSALVATILLTHYQRGISKEDMVQDVLWLNNEIRIRGGNVRRECRDKRMQWEDSARQADCLFPL